MNWVEKSLDELGLVSRGKSKHRPRDSAHLYGGPYPFVQTGSVKHAGLYLSDYTQTYSEAGLAQSKLWPKGTLCITIAANIADTSILDIEACFPDSVIGFIPYPDKADTRFIKYLFDAKLKLAYRQFTQGAAQDNLSQGKLLSIKFSIPEDVKEQSRIADLVAQYDNLIENNNRRIQLLEESARLLYKEWFIHLRFPGHEHVKTTDDVPEGWNLGCIGDLVEVKSGFAFKSKDWREEGNPVVKIKNITKSGKIDFNGCQCIDDNVAEKAARFELFPGDMLIAMTGATVGKLGLMPRVEKKYYLNQRVGKYFPKIETNPIPFLFCFSKFKGFNKNIINLAGGAAQPNISGKQIESIEILVPEIKVLEWFNENMNPVLLEREILLEQINKLAKARDILLPRLMNGELAV